MYRRILIALIVCITAAMAVETASAASVVPTAWRGFGYRSRSYAPNNSTVRTPSGPWSNSPGWQRSYPRGSVRDYGYLPFYMRADRRPLGLTP